MEGGLTCLTSQVHILLKIRLKKRGRQGERKYVSVCKYIYYISSSSGPMSDWISNGYDVSNDSDSTSEKDRISCHGDNSEKL